MKKQRLSCYITLGILVVSLILTALVSCSGGGSYDKGNMAGDVYYPTGDSVNGSSTSKPGIGGSENGIGSIPTGGVDNPSAMIIKKATAEINTKEYDALIESLYEKITEFEGYTDSESFSGSYARTASITIRIPAARLDEFKEVLSGLGTMTYYFAEKEDVTLTYSVLSARKETLTLEISYVEELFEIAKEKSDLTAIANLEQRLTDIRLEIAGIDAQLSSYDNSIAYSTVKLTVREVYEYVAPEPVEKGVFERIGEGFTNNLKSIGSFLVEFFIWFVSSLPILIIWVAIIFFALLLLNSLKKYRLARKSASAKTEEAISNEETNDTTNDKENPEAK